MLKTPLTHALPATLPAKVVQVLLSTIASPVLILYFSIRLTISVLLHVPLGTKGFKMSVLSAT